MAGLSVSLIGCSKRKLGRRAPARELYLGQTFRLALRYAEARADRTFVVSALHGLVLLEQELEPYDFTLARDRRRRVDRDRWADAVVGELARAAGVPSSLELLLGEAYAWPLVRAIGRRQERGAERWPAPTMPLASFGTGLAKRWLAAR